MNHTGPTSEDIVVGEEWQNGQQVFTLQVLQDADCYSIGSREAAIALAVTFAECERVRAWLHTPEGFELLEAY